MDCTRTATDFGTVPGIGMYEMILSRSEMSDSSAKGGECASDTGIGLGTSVTVVSKPGVDLVEGADTDFTRACIVGENVVCNGAVDCPKASAGDSLDKVSG